jgi:hypothetical protein
LDGSEFCCGQVEDLICDDPRKPAKVAGRADVFLLADDRIATVANPVTVSTDEGYHSFLLVLIFQPMIASRPIRNLVILHDRVMNLDGRVVGIQIDFFKHTVNVGYRLIAILAVAVMRVMRFALQHFGMLIIRKLFEPLFCLFCLLPFRLNLPEFLNGRKKFAEFPGFDLIVHIGVLVCWFGAGIPAK